MRAYLEIINYCNRSCSFCPGTKRPPMAISPAVFAERLKKIAPVTDEIFLHILGEPLLHPQLPELLAIAEVAGMPVNITTNGTLLNEVLFDLLWRPIVRQINFSLHGLLEHDDAIPDTIFDFSARSLVKRPDLYINFRLWNQGVADFDVNRMIFDAAKRHLNAAMPDFIAGHRSSKITGRLYWNIDRPFVWPDGEGAETGRGRCHGLGTQFGVLTDGRVVPCCLDCDGAITLGNLDDYATMAEILNSDRATAIREGFHKGMVTESFCRSCSFRSRFD